jgi:hypothetical protein
MLVDSSVDSISMAKVGRRKKSGERYACGKLKPRGVPGAHTLWRRIKDHGIRLGMNPELGSVLGRLSLFGEISEREVEAGRYFARVVANFERDAGCPPRLVKSPTYEAAFNNGFREVHSGSHSDARLRRSQRRFDEFDRIFYDSHTRAIVEEVCCNDREISASELPTLRSGLTALADHLRIRGNNNNTRSPIAEPTGRRSSMLRRDRTRRSGNSGCV